ncbi:hypothetical protein [Kingella negevensis]|uniref:hypothetical protein n=1 Tax=Kingella negevensis TaxID=1522312 RepID=UPI00050A054B|nr:hypothetical protein [Kingella negevensis]MDK4688513.1 hypothetical protein [Kingella negevensis]WII91752.1 hypothetical protein QEO93_03985 [Kingella negevensis]
MYRNIDECLRQTYKILGVEMSPRGNTGAVMQWLETKGVGGSGGELSQSEHHANAVMIANQVSGCLNSPLLTAVVECQYGKTDNVLMIAGALVANKICDDVSFAVDMLRHIYSMGEKPRRVWIIDKYDLHDMTFARKRAKFENHLANWEQKARFQLQREFVEKGILSA